MRHLARAALAAAFVATPLSALADEFTLDLTKIDPSTPKGQERIRIWKQDMAEAYCGPVRMPQPIELIGVRANCQAVVRDDVQKEIDAAYARQAKQVTYVKVVSSNR